MCPAGRSLGWLFLRKRSSVGVIYEESKDRGAGSCSPNATMLELAAISKESSMYQDGLRWASKLTLGACKDRVGAGLALLACSTGAEILQAHCVLHGA